MKERLKLIPYCDVDGCRTFRDTEIRDLYERMVQDGTAETVFSARDITTAEEFLEAMKHGAHNLFVVMVDGQKAGIVWLNMFEGRFARCHWCVFSPYWGKESVEIGKESLRLVMNMKDREGIFMLDMLLGIVPSMNRLAINYCEKCGGIIQGEIPYLSMWQGNSVPGTIIYYTREGGAGHG